MHTKQGKMFSKQDYGRLRKYNTIVGAVLVFWVVCVSQEYGSDKQQRLFLEFRKFLNQIVLTTKY